jgi:hypothetical protein
MNVDVYQANHHGSASSSCSAFLKDLQPSIVIISNGDNSTYKHPRQVTLDTLAILDSPPLVIQTNKLLKGSPGGNVADRFIADLESSDDDGTIVINADKSTKTISISYRDTVISRPWKNQGSGPDSSAPRLVIESLLADPAGNDRDLEEVTIRNAGTHAVPMANWYLRDRQGRVWALSSIGSIPGGASRTVTRSGMAMSLDNDGDEVFLFDPANVLRDRFEYSSIETNIRISTGH